MAVIALYLSLKSAIIPLFKPSTVLHFFVKYYILMMTANRRLTFHFNIIQRFFIL